MDEKKQFQKQKLNIDAHRGMEQGAKVLKGVGKRIRRKQHRRGCDEYFYRDRAGRKGQDLRIRQRLGH